MPKPRKTKQSDYLQFRPYHAFTASSARPAKAGNMAKWWLLAIAAVVLLGMAVAWLSHRG